MHAVLCTCRLKSTFIYEFYIDLNYSGQNSVQCSVIQLARSCLCTAQISCCSYLCSKSTAHINGIGLGRKRHRRRIQLQGGGRRGCGIAQSTICRPVSGDGCRRAPRGRQRASPPPFGGRRLRAQRNRQGRLGRASWPHWWRSGRRLPPALAAAGPVSASGCPLASVCASSVDRQTRQPTSRTCAGILDRWAAASWGGRGHRCRRS